MTSPRQYASYEFMHFHELEMFMKYRDFWVNHCQLKSMRLGLPLESIRADVLAVISNVATKFSQVLMAHQYKYYARIDESTAPLDKQAFTNMAKIYASDFLPYLLLIVDKIGQYLDKINIPDVRQGLNDTLDELCHYWQNNLESISNLRARGKALGPVFNANPAIFLLGAPMICMPNSEISKKPVEEAIEIIENIKQQISVRCAIQPYCLVLINSIQALRKYCKGMAACDIKPNNNAPILRAPDSLDLSKYLTCYLTGKIMKHPVTIASGHTFEREAISVYLSEKSVCPIKLTELKSKKFVTNYIIKSLCDRVNNIQKDNLPELDSPISYERFKDPVITSTGMTLDRDELDIILNQNGNCPLTGQPLDKNIQYKNELVADLIRFLS